MSRIYFRTKAGEVQVLGSERFHLLGQVHQLLDTVGRPHSGQVLPTAADLNACLQLGTDVARLVARLAAQVEGVLWVDGPNRAWLAGLLDAAAAVGSLRPDAGWREAWQLLLSSDAVPVFICCSQGEQFPPAEGWAEGEAVLRGESEREDATAGPTLVAAPFSRELRPSSWCAFFFAE